MSSPGKVLRRLFGPLTTRGRSFLAAGGAAVVCGLAIPEPDLVWVGALLVVLPVVSALIARRSRYRLACTRRLDPPLVAVGQSTTVTTRVENVSRLPTDALLVEDLTPDPTDLRDCVSKLPPRSQSLLALRYERSLKLGEIAREVGSTLDAVHKLLTRIRENLQECLQRWLQSDQR